MAKTDAYMVAAFHTRWYTYWRKALYTTKGYWCYMACLTEEEAIIPENQIM